VTEARGRARWPGRRGGRRVKTEADALDPHPLPAQRESLTAIRVLEDAVLSAPLEGIVLRYGNFYGPGASDAMLELIRKRQFPLVGGGRGVWSWIHLDDAAAATLAALERGRRGLYNVTDDEPAPVAEWLPFLAQTIGAKPPRRFPTWIGVNVFDRHRRWHCPDGALRDQPRQAPTPRTGIRRLGVPARHLTWSVRAVADRALRSEAGRADPGGSYAVTRQKPLPKGSAQRVRLPQSPDSWPSTIPPSLVISDVDRPTSSTAKSR
jgi:nucleoside-diphosphate-sugar epimerase